MASLTIPKNANVEVENLKYPTDIYLYIGNFVFVWNHRNDSDCMLWCDGDGFLLERNKSTPKEIVCALQKWLTRRNS